MNDQLQLRLLGSHSVVGVSLVEKSGVRPQGYTGFSTDTDIFLALYFSSTYINLSLSCIIPKMCK
jgi:nitrogen regulatory protein PII-like uncharacterized protein